MTNLDDRPIQVGSHYHLLELNPLMRLDRRLAYGMRLNIAAGTAVRFEPGVSRTVSVVAIGGARVVRGGNHLAQLAPGSEGGRVDEAAHWPDILARLTQKGFAHQAAAALPSPMLSARFISRSVYASMHGPTRGDRIRLGDTSLHVEIESVAGEQHTCTAACHPASHPTATVQGPAERGQLLRPELTARDVTLAGPLFCLWLMCMCVQVGCVRAVRRLRRRAQVRRRQR